MAIQLTTSRYRWIYVHLALGLIIIPFGLGHLELGDFSIRLPAILVVALDAATAFVIALTYSRIWPRRDQVPWPLRQGMFHPTYAWLAAVGYYLMCVWVVMAILARPDGPVGGVIAWFFLGGFVLILIYKLAMVRLSSAVEETLNQ